MKFIKNTRNNQNGYVKKSVPAVCAATEREVTVKSENVNRAIKSLRTKGYYIVGTSYGKTPTKKIWFIRPGGL